MEKLDVMGETHNPIAIDIDYCSVGKDGRPNEDYVLLGEKMYACVADGIGGAPLGDAVARYACHAAMRVLKRNGSTELAVVAAQDQVMRFVSDIDSLRSGTSLVVIALRGKKLEASWAGDTALFVLKRGREPHEVVSSLDADLFGTTPPLGKSNDGRMVTVSDSIDDVDCIAVCTDGAWRATGREEIGRLLATEITARETAAKIVLGRPSRDDSTALVARFHRGTRRPTMGGLHD
ncbi:MAG: protein phosphatase 2C domain-containing protein [Coriobacteriales bacterium]|nr:protein phosphatase 2C domain-containing protein [Coriobacteriales bacterium]